MVFRSKKRKNLGCRRALKRQKKPLRKEQRLLASLEFLAERWKEARSYTFWDPNTTLEILGLRFVSKELIYILRES